MIKKDARTPSGIPELDSVLKGGFLKGSLILLAGHPGAGKTTFSATFIYKGITLFNEKGVYLNFSESKEDFYTYMMNFGMNFRELEKEGKFRYIDALSVVNPRDLDEIIRFLVESIIDMDAKRVVIDSLSTITDLLPPEKTRALINNTLAKILKKLGATTILIMDLPYGETKIGHGIEEFITDVVLILYSRVYDEKVERFMEIRKLRGLDIEMQIIPYVIKSNGLDFILPPSQAIEGRYLEIQYTTGIQELDKMLQGGINKGTLTGILGPAGSGKTVIALKIAIHNALSKRKVLYLSFTESEEQLKKRIEGLGYNFDEISEYLYLKAINPFGYPLNHLLAEFRDLIRKINPEIYVVDSLERFKLALGEERFIKYINRRTHELKSSHLTTILTMSANYPQERVYIDDIADNLIVLEIKYDEKKIERILYIWKTRGKKGEDKGAKISFDEDGNVVIQVLE